MNDTTKDRLRNLQRPWPLVEARIARDRADRASASGSAASMQAMWATECELRASPGYARARQLDLQHHFRWRRLLDRLATASAR